MGSKLLLVAFLAQEISIGVFSLFRSERAVSHPATDGVLLEIPGRIQRYFRGTLVSLEPVPVVRMEVEAAVAAVVAAEMPSDAPAEALKAFAVVARSFYLAAGCRHERYDFCDTTHCQFHRESAPMEHSASKAVVATSGIRMVYRGRSFAPMYSASCGGSTRRAADVGLSEASYPYASVECEYCSRAAGSWTRRVRREDSGSLVHERSEAARLDFVRQRGWSALPSNNYTVRISGDELIFTGRGQGHGVGLCQRGAIAMAKNGASFREILRHYFPGTELVGKVFDNHD